MSGGRIDPYLELHVWDPWCIRCCFISPTFSLKFYNETKGWILLFLNGSDENSPHQGRSNVAHVGQIWPNLRKNCLSWLNLRPRISEISWGQLKISSKSNCIKIKSVFDIWKVLGAGSPHYWTNWYTSSHFVCQKTLIFLH